MELTKELVAVVWDRVLALDVAPPPPPPPPRAVTSGNGKNIIIVLAGVFGDEVSPSSSLYWKISIPSEGEGRISSPSGTFFSSETFTTSRRYARGKNAKKNELSVK